MMRARFLALSVAAAAAGTSCSKGGSAPASETAANHSEPTMTTDGDSETTAPTCTTEAEARAALGTVCTLFGTYQLKELHSQKGEVFRTWPVVILADGAAVALESSWDESKMPSDEDIARYRDQAVEVTGMLHAQPPAEDRRANMSQLTLSPVESIRLAE